jgi:hypothetical protein
MAVNVAPAHNTYKPALSDQLAHSGVVAESCTAVTLYATALSAVWEGPVDHKDPSDNKPPHNR